MVVKQGRLLVFATFIRPMTDPDHELTHVSHSLATLTAARSAV
jgi:hypothetical protein